MAITIKWDIKAFQDGATKPCFECQFTGPPDMVPTWLDMMSDFIAGLKTIGAADAPAATPPGAGAG